MCSSMTGGFLTVRAAKTRIIIRGTKTEDLQSHPAVNLWNTVPMERLPL